MELESLQWRSSLVIPKMKIIKYTLICNEYIDTLYITIDLKVPS